jgi:hypothetical protein
MWELRLVIAVIFLFLAIISFPLTAIAKYGKRNRLLTMIFAGGGAVSTLAFMILIWPYIPD